MDIWIRRTGSRETRTERQLGSLSTVRDNHPEKFSKLVAIAAGYPAPVPQPARTASAPTPRGDTGTQVAGDHIDMRNGNFYGRVVGEERNYYNTLPAPVEWRPVGEVGAGEFGVHPTGPVAGLPDVPPYVPRDRDDDLRAQLDRPGLVLIVGEPYAGKSYTAWHGVRLLEDRRLYAPYPGEDLRPLEAALRKDPGKHVVWLDELTEHLGPGLLDLRLLRRLNQLGAVVLGTISPTEYYLRRARSAPDDQVVTAARPVLLEREWSDAELERLSALDDPRAYPAYMWSGKEGVAPYFAVGQLLFDEWQREGTRSEHPRGQSLVRAAVDLARCGVTGAVPAELLRKVQEQYGAAGETGEGEPFEDALAWATARMFRVSGLLVAGEEDGTWRAYGALVAEALRAGNLEPVPDEVWWTLLDAAIEGAPLDKDAILGAARAALRSRVEAGDAEVMFHLAYYLDGQESVSLLCRAADAGHTDAAAEAALIFLSDEDKEKALPYLEIAAEGGSSWAALHLGRIHRDRAERWLLTAAEAGKGAAAHELADLLLTSDVNLAREWYLESDRLGYVEGARSQGMFQLIEGQREAAEIWLTRAADAGDEQAAELLEVVFHKPSPLDDDYFDGDANPLIYPLDATHQGVLLEMRGRLDEARKKYEKGYTVADAYGAYRLAALLAKEGKPDEARQWYRKSADMGHPGALKALGETSDKPDTVKE
ncbi:tetratricopeptide repeat protein [Streptomyces sp. NPDC002671]